MSHAGQAVEAQHRERTIEVKVRFFTNELAGKEGYIIPKHGWTTGSVQMDRNLSHNIVPKDPVTFNSLMEIPAVIEKVLINHGIILHRVKKTKKYTK